ncbi:hypothetical protein ACJRO7_013741 [Eucalyptus globulus]|uniref:Uncharacterized protein n=1 Tax=Eucalyptus globulus TaxID=34317 RepID=A0ABD3KYT4_EUCGL
MGMSPNCSVLNLKSRQVPVVQVLWATDPLVKGREGVGAGVGAKEEKNGSRSKKLLRNELPLSRHGEGHKLASTIVNSQKGLRRRIYTRGTFPRQRNRSLCDDALPSNHDRTFYTQY